ncbi:MAG: peptidase S1 [Anaerolineaceae bacterium]|nr:peptidase S1 [Anaerolineaceae bacterium]
MIGRRLFPFASGAAAALLILLIYNLMTPEPQLLNERDVEDAIAAAMASATPPPALSAQVYQIIQPSLVLIETQPSIGGNSNIRYETHQNLHFVQDEIADVASGVIVNDSGDILTSLHVLGNATNLQITFADGSLANAEIVGAMPENDIAVLRPDRLPEQAVAATLGNPNAMRIGDEAFVVGHPFGLYGSMSVGVISGFERTFETPDGMQNLQGLIQFDAATNPGTSGGPLLNRYGQVVGIVTMLMNPTGQDVFIGIGFAVPITTAGGAAGLPPQ